jgi:WD40 repeat protein
VRDSAIRHIAVSLEGRAFAVAEFKSKVSIWDFEGSNEPVEFSTVLDFGGHRLALNQEGSCCVAGGYYAGISCYRTKDGDVVWARKDLKQVQRIRFLPSDSEVACGFEDGPLQILRIKDGKTLQKVRDCRDLILSHYRPIQFADKKVPELQTPDGSRRAYVPRESFAVLSAVFGHNELVISEAAGPVRCLDIGSGATRWRHTFSEGTHALKVGYDRALRRFMAIEWPYEKGGMKTLCIFEAGTGAILNRFPLGSSSVEAFCLRGTRLLSSAGWLLDTSSGRVVGQFAFPAKEYRDE